MSSCVWLASSACGSDDEEKLVKADGAYRVGAPAAEAHARRARLLERLGARQHDQVRPREAAPVLLLDPRQVMQRLHTREQTATRDTAAAART